MYVELEGIGELADKISCDFESDAFHLLIRDDEFTERRLTVEGLNRPIDPEKSTGS